MSHSSLNPSLRAPVVATLASAAHAAGTHTTDAIDMGSFANVQVIATVGAFGSGASGTLKFEQSATADFAIKKDIEGRPAVAITENKPAVIDLNQGELDINGNFQYVRAVLKATTQSVTAGLAVLGFDARHAPAEPVVGTVVDTRAK